MQPFRFWPPLTGFLSILSFESFDTSRLVVLVMSYQHLPDVEKSYYKYITR
jgi:hypothetical protein